MATSATYEPDERSKGNRLAKRTGHDQELIRSIVDSTPILHVSFNAPAREGPQFPTILPMLGAMGRWGADEDDSIYLHGSSAARLFHLQEQNHDQPVPLCVCATLLDGYVLALAPFHPSGHYRAAVLFGYGEPVSDPDEVEYALRLITDNTVPHRWANSRSPATRAELTATGVLKVRVETASVKVRRGGPSDERADLRNPDVVDRTWIGVVPTYMTLGEPVAGEHNRLAHPPEYIADWVADRNSLNEQEAIDAMDEGGD